MQGLKNRRCAMCRSEFPVEFLERPELLMPIDSVASTSNAEPNEYQWFYKGRNGNFLINFLKTSNFVSFQIFCFFFVPN